MYISILLTFSEKENINIYMANFFVALQNKLFHFENDISKFSSNWFRTSKTWDQFLAFDFRLD